MAPARLQIHARRMVLGGRDHSGWLPEGAGLPPLTATSEVLVDFLIEGDDDGAMLYWNGRDGTHWNYWRESVQGAIEQAEFSWGIQPHEWKPA